MALESEPQSTPLGGSNLDALKTESSNDLDLEDGEIDDDDEEETAPAVTPAAAPTPTPAPASGPSTPRAPPIQKGHDRRERHENSSPPPWAQRRLNHGPPNMNKMKKSNKNSWGPPHSNSFTHEEDDDDFAVHLEKALREKAREKAKDAIKERSGEEGEGGESEDEENYRRKRKKRRKSRDEDGERDSRHRKKRREGDEEEDDMIFVRNASPHHDPSTSPSYRDCDRSYDSYGEEEEDYDDGPDYGGHGGFSSRGRGRGSKITRGRGRGRLGGVNEGGRGGFLNKRGSKRGSLRGGPAGKSQRLGRDRTHETLCMYYMQGKCPKDADECPYSHDAMPRRKMELCKFYNMNCCAKREKCLYMHKDFPCKFFHTGRRCDSGDKCRFSHDKLTDNTRSVLLKHIELAPKEILGEFRRLTREEANQIIDRAAKLRAEGKNPEGMDLLRLHDDDNGSGDDRSHTPMPSSPGEIEQNEPESRKNRAEDSSRKRDHHEHNRDRNRDRNQTFGGDRRDHSDRREPSDRREHRERRRKRRWDTPEESSPQLSKLEDAQQKQLQEVGGNEKILEKRLPHKSSAQNTDITSSDEDKNFNTSAKNNAKDSKSGLELKGEFSLDTPLKNSPDSAIKDEPSLIEKHGALETSGGESGEESQDSTGNIPAHLPKRQRELFLRIQQQQREAEHNQANKDNESEDDPAAEDDWYSSDEDGPKTLTDVLKNLKQGQDKELDQNSRKQEEYKSNKKISSAAKRNSWQPADDGDKPKVDQSKESSTPARRPPLLPTPNIITDLIKNTTIDQLLSTIRYAPSNQGQTNAALVPAPAPVEITSTPVGLQSPGGLPSGPSSVPVRDPRLSRDPRSRSTVLPNTSPSASPSSNPNPVEVRMDPRLEKQDVRVDPRSERRDPRTLPRQASHSLLDTLSSPRSDQRGDFRQVDPRASRTEIRRSSEGSCSSTGSNTAVSNSIYEAAHLPILSGAGDVDLRVRNIAPNAVGDTDFRRQLGAGDMDLRRDLSSNLPSASAFPLHDTDLRFGVSHSGIDTDGDYTAASHSDLDLRKIQMMLPFKPAPVHTPATEIDASSSSYTPGPYHVVLVDIPKPDLSNLKIDPRDDQAKLDPRLRRFFGLNQKESTSSTTSTSPTTGMSPQINSTSLPLVPPSDPRRRNSNTSTSRPADPRQSRHGVGANTCPPTPRADEFEEPNLADTDLRVQSLHGRPQNQWDSFASRSRGLLPHPDHTWTNTASAYGSRLPNVQSHSFHQQRSYTPPPT